MFSAAPGPLPADGSPVVAGISLPPGARVLAESVPVAWLSTEVLPEDELTDLCRTLAAAFPQTGLWPLHATGLADGDLSRPWRDGELDGPDERVLEASDVLKGVELAEAAPGRELPADRVEIEGPGGLLLVPVDRPANVPKALGWMGAVNADLGGEALSCVLRSWEDRFGVTLVGIGFDTLVVQAPRVIPDDQLPRLLDEHYAFCPDNIDQGMARDLYLDALGIWTHWSFWWD